MRILLARNDKIGDFMTTLPAVYLFKKNHPKSFVAVLVNKINTSLAKKCSFIDEVIVDESKILNLVKKIRAFNFDVGVAFFNNTHVALAFFLARIPQRIAPATKLAQIFYTKKVRQKRSRVKMSEMHYNIDLLTQTLGLNDREIPMPFFPKVLENGVFKTSISELLLKHLSFIQNPKKTVVLHPGFDGSSEANLTLLEYIQVAAFIQKMSWEVLFSFGPGEQNLQKECQDMCKKHNLKMYFFKSTIGLFDYGRLMGEFGGFVSTSTGTFHLACAFGTPTFTFFGNSLFASSKRWQGIGSLDKQHHLMIDTQNKKEILNFFYKQLRNFLEKNN